MADLIYCIFECRLTLIIFIFDNDLYMVKICKQWISYPAGRAGVCERASEWASGMGERTGRMARNNKRELDIMDFLIQSGVNKGLCLIDILVI